MRLLSSIRTFLNFVFRRDRVEHDMEEELRSHIQDRADDLEQQGLARAEAERQARIEFGGFERYKEECREALGTRLLQELIADLRYGLRQLRRNPGFTAVAIIILALGIGANTGIFSLVNSVLLRTLPVKDPQQLVTIRLPDPHGGYNGIPYLTFQYLRDHNSVLSGMFAFSIPEHLDVAIDGHAELVSGQVVSGGYYSTLGVNAVLGRTIAPRDDAPGRPPVTMISYGYWRQQFAADPDVIGKSIEINGAAFTIIGVTPPGFFGLITGFSPDVTTSMNMQPLLMGDGTLPNDRSTWAVETVGGRLRPGVTLQQARANLGLLFSQTLGTAQQRNEMRIEVMPGSRGLPVVRKHFMAPLVVLMVIVGLVLLIACGNIANLLLARGTVRRKEIAMRLALGASRSRMVRQLLSESVLLAILGGAGGLAFAVWVRHLLLAAISGAGLPVSISAPLDSRVLGFTALVALASGVLFGFVPAIQATQVNLTPDLNAKPGVAGGTRGKLGLGRALVVSQIAGSLLLMVGVGLFVHTLWDLQDVYPGFNAEHVLLFSVEPHLVGYKGTRLANLYKELLETIQGLPGVRSVSASRFAPLTPASAYASISIPSHVPLRDENQSVQESFVGPNFFQAMGMPLLLGRDFTFQDAGRGPRVAVINQTTALRYFGKGNPIGVRFNLSQRKGLIQVIGVVKDAKYHSLREPATATVFLPLLQFSPDAQRLTFEVRTAMNPQSVAAAVRQRIEAIDQNLAMIDVRSLTEQTDQSLMPVRLIATLSGLFALLALLLVCVGLYGIMAYSVVRRTHEIGIRMALGAQKSDVLKLVVGQGMILTLIGVGIGIIGALGLTRFLSSLLYGVKPTDPLTFVVVSLILTTVALLACYIPARRAMKIDPMEALRYE